MPIAGGTPIAVALIVVLIGAQLAGKRETKLEGPDVVLLAISAGLLTLELITALITNASADLEYAFGRIYWIALLLAAVTFSNAEFSRGNRTFIFSVLSIGLAILLVAMLAESLFYPRFGTGRNFGAIHMPIPRATGVPNSDGKVGTFLAICLCAGLFYSQWLSRWRTLLLVAGSLLGLLFTQSRSGFLAFIAVIGLHWIYRSFRDRNLFLLAVRWLVIVVATVLLLYNLAEIIVELVGQGTLKKNVMVRLHHVSYALDRMTEAPLLGSGAEAIRENLNRSGVHNTVLAMTLKSGAIAALLITVIILYPLLAFRGNTQFTWFKLAVIAGLVTEHMLYPGFINEFLIIAYITVKTCWRLGSATPIVQGPPWESGSLSVRGGAYRSIFPPTAPAQ